LNNPFIQHLIGLTPLTTLIAAFSMPLVNYIVKGSKKTIQIVALIASIIPLITSFILFIEAYCVDEVLVYKFGNWPRQ